MRIDIQQLARTVQHNCHVSDARHGADYGLCTYLMKMREYYRWERALPFSAALEKDQVGEWLTRREALWAELDEAEFSPLSLGEEDFDPYDVEGVNRWLNPLGYVYSGGLGNSGRPHFFLAELVRNDVEGVLVSGRELARDLASPPAMNQGQLIFVRRESLRRMLWERLESWRWSHADNAMGRAFAGYDFKGDLESALDQMTDDEIELVLLHEQGEREAGDLLGEEWNGMLQEFVFTPAELIARAVRDHLADALVTLPVLARETRPSSVHFYIGNLSGMRKEIFPELHTCYENWRSGGDGDGFLRLAEQGRRYWLRLAREIMALHSEAGSDAAKAVVHRVQDQSFSAS